MKKYEILGNNDTRSGFGDALAILGNENPNVVALCADLTGSLKWTNSPPSIPTDSSR